MTIEPKVPQNLRAERAVLGAVMIEGALNPEIKNILAESSFTHPDHALLWGIFKELDEKHIAIDMISILGAASRRAANDITALWLTELLDATVTTSNLLFYGKEVYRAYLARLAMDAANEVLRGAASQELESVMEHAVSKFTDLNQRLECDSLSSDSLFDTAVHYIDHPPRATPWGMTSLDMCTSGATIGEISILAGRPGEMKTTFALNRMWYWLNNSDKKILMISKEMVTYVLMWKLASMESGIPFRKIKMNKLSLDEKAQVLDIIEKIRQKWAGRLYITENTYTLNDTENLIRTVQPDIVIDDFIQLSTPKKRDELRYDIIEFMKMYKRLAKQFQLHVCVVAQMNREIEKRLPDDHIYSDTTPRLSDLGESGSLEQLASDVIFISYPFKRTYNRVHHNHACLYIAKARYGEPGRIHVKCIPEIGHFAEVSAS
jgi:replicative DNA helicase